MLCASSIQISYIETSVTISSSRYKIEVDLQSRVTITDKKNNLIILPPTDIISIIECPKKYNINSEIYLLINIISREICALKRSPHLN